MGGGDLGNIERAWARFQDFNTQRIVADAEVEFSALAVTGLIAFGVPGCDSESQGDVEHLENLTGQLSDQCSETQPEEIPGLQACQYYPPEISEHDSEYYSVEAAIAQTNRLLTTESCQFRCGTSSFLALCDAEEGSGNYTHSTGEVCDFLVTTNIRGESVDMDPVTISCEEYLSPEDLHGRRRSTEVCEEPNVILIEEWQ